MLWLHLLCISLSGVRSFPVDVCVCFRTDWPIGFPYSFPIFQTYLTSGPEAPYPESVSIRLLAPGIQDILEGILFPFLPSGGRHRKLMLASGIAIIAFSLTATSYASADWQIVLAQGVGFGLGGILMNFVHVSVFSEWFDKRRGLAMGIIWSGWRIGALAFPLICQWLLQQHGFARTLRVLIPPMMTLLAPSVLLLRGRYHGSMTSMQPRTAPVSKLVALRKLEVLYYLIATSIYYLVVNVPKMFIATFAADLDTGPSSQAWALVLLVLSEMAGTYISGWLSDKNLPFDRILAALAFGTSISHIIGLGCAKSAATVFLYAVVVGCTSGGAVWLS
jgi:MFS family permease